MPKLPESRAEWTPENGLVVSGEMTVTSSPSYIRLVSGEIKSHATVLVGLIKDGRRILLDLDDQGSILGIEIV